jgi:tetratricopeptide (TPR) repeat protein
MLLRLLRRAQYFADRGAPRQAVALYDQVLAAHPHDRGAWLWSAVALSDLGRFDEARVRLNRVQPAPSSLFLARLLYDAGHYTEARELLPQGNLHAAILRAACLVRLSDSAAAASLLAGPLPHAPWALARLLAAIEDQAPLPPPSPAPLPADLRGRGGVRRGLVLLRTERWLDALAAFRHAPSSALAGYGQAVALYYLQHLEPAEQLLNEALPDLAEPFASDALSILGKVDVESRRFSTGVLRLRQAIARGAATPENYYALGVGLLRQRALPLATRAFGRCVSVDFVRRRFGDLRAIVEA